MFSTVNWLSRSILAEYPDYACCRDQCMTGTCKLPFDPSADIPASDQLVPVWPVYIIRDMDQPLVAPQPYLRAAGNLSLIDTRYVVEPVPSILSSSVMWNSWLELLPAALPRVNITSATLSRYQRCEAQLDSWDSSVILFFGHWVYSMQVIMLILYVVIFVDCLIVACCGTKGMGDRCLDAGLFCVEKMHHLLRRLCPFLVRRTSLRDYFFIPSPNVGVGMFASVFLISLTAA